MKKLIAFTSGLIIVLNLFSQDKPAEMQPNGMVFIPQGAFDMELTLNSEKKMRHVTVDAFWMSNEITNGEFREFIDWAKNNPGEKLYKVKYSFKTVTDPDKGMTKDTMVRVTTTIDASEISSAFVEPVFPEKLNKGLKNYFTDMTFDDFPVVGVSFKLAQYFCIWKTDQENIKLRAKGQPDIHTYRIPLESEWEYVAQKPILKNGSTESAIMIEKVKSGDVNEWGLNHFGDNVSEWAVQNRGEGSIIRGGSWKTGNNISERQVCDPDLKEPFIGFRIVRSYNPGKK
jgi:formylglycine-generating enzyme required for sulfatase activity